MLYKFRNVNNDECVELFLSEIATELEQGNDNGVFLQEKITKESNSKGNEIQEIVLFIEQEVLPHGQEIIATIEEVASKIIWGIIPNVIWDLLKGKIKKYKRLQEYSDETNIEVVITDEQQEVKICVSLGEIENRG